MPSNRPQNEYDCVVVGGGPNGLTAAAFLARAGKSVAVFEAGPTVGGGCRTSELTLPGFLHDVCGTVHPMGVISPAFRDLRLEEEGLQWIWSDIALAHPLPGAEPALMHRNLAQTANGLGVDAGAWEKLMAPFLDGEFIESLLQPVWWTRGGGLLRKARFGLTGLKSAAAVAAERFSSDAARALFVGCAAHSVMDLQRAGTASFGLMLALTGHRVGWPIARGGSVKIVEALLRCLQRHRAEVVTGRPISSLTELPPARAILFDVNPRQVARICGDALPSSYRRKLEHFPHGPGIFKVDWALSRPIPWRDAPCARAATVHVGGHSRDVAQSEAEMAAGKVPARPFVLVVQQSLFDPTRAPAGKHTGWAYCHVPARCEVDMTAAIESQIERFAPGFRDCILARHTAGPAAVERYNAAMVGGDIGGGRNDLATFLFRPVPRWNPYRTPNRRIYLCSSSTPPGGGVHGMCGYWAAQEVLKQ